MAYIEANGINMYYEERGEGEPLLLIMGLGTDHAGWDKHVVEFEKHFRCILPDNRGTGKTDKPEGPYTIRMMAEDSLACMDRLGIEKAHVNGCSMGGAIALEMVRMAPERVGKIVLTASFAKLDAYGKRIPLVFKNAYDAMDRKAYKELTDLIVYSRRFHINNMSELEEMENAEKPDRMPLHAFCAQADALIECDATGWLGNIENDCLICAGECDLFSPLEHAVWMKDTMPNAELIVDHGRGHTFHFENAENYNKNVVSFLEER